MADTKLGDYVVSPNEWSTYQARFRNRLFKVDDLEVIDVPLNLAKELCEVHHEGMVWELLDTRGPVAVHHNSTSNYATVRRDWAKLDALAELNDQVEIAAEIDRLLETPTKAAAAELYRRKIVLWFEEHGYDDATEKLAFKYHHNPKRLHRRDNDEPYRNSER